MKTKTIIAAFVATLLTTTVATTAASATTSSNSYLGDVDRDGKITASDASSVLAEYASLMTVKGTTSSNSYLGDVDRDGKITASDASFILAYYAAESTGTPAVWPTPNLTLMGTYMFTSPKEVTMNGTPMTLGPGEHFGIEGITDQVMYVYVAKAPSILALPYTAEELQQELIRVN